MLHLQRKERKKEKEKLLDLPKYFYPTSYTFTYVKCLLNFTYNVAILCYVIPIFFTTLGSYNK